MIVGTIVLVIVAVLVLVSYSTLHKAPSCVDNLQNQGEAGIDCGGPCPYLCTEQVQAPVVRFTQTVANANGTTDVIAYVDNPNTGAYARSVAYSVSLYGADHTLGAGIQHGTIDLPPGASVPVFLPNINSGNNTITSAFLTIDPSTIKWQAGTDTRIVPSVGSAMLGGTTALPRLTAVLNNPGALPLSNVKVIVVLFDTAGNVLDVSQTIVPSIAGQGSATATFTWTTPFASAPARVDVLPIIGLALGA